MLRAIPMIYSLEREKFEEAGQLIKRALRIEPGNAMVLAWAAYWQHVACRPGAGPQNPAATLDARAKSCACSAMQDRSRQCGGARHLRAHAARGSRISTIALDYFDRVAALNPNLAFVWALSAITYCYIGKPGEALKRTGALSRACAVRPLFLFLREHLLHRLPVRRRL